MEQRGRKSSAALTIVPSSPVVAVTRPSAPDDLTNEQAEEWTAVINRLPADWFPRETHGLLASYCRHVVAGRRIAQLIANAEKSKALDLDEYDKLLKMQERESRAASSLATRMRLTQQTTYIPTKKKGGPTIEMPWDDD